MILISEIGSGGVRLVKGCRLYFQKVIIASTKINK